MDDKKTEKQATGKQTFQIVVFRLGMEEYGMHIGQIKEVVITPQVTRMPQTPSFIKGVANIRGNIIAILDLEEKFGMKKEGDSEQKKHNYTLVIESDEYKMGVLVKDVPNTLSISATDIEETVLTGEGNPEHAYVKGIVKLPQRLVIMIDIFKVMTEQELGQVFKKNTVTAA